MISEKMLLVALTLRTTIKTNMRLLTKLTFNIILLSFLFTNCKKAENTCFIESSVPQIGAVNNQIIILPANSVTLSDIIIILSGQSPIVGNLGSEINGTNVPLIMSDRFATTEKRNLVAENCIFQFATIATDSKSIYKTKQIIT